MRLSTAIRVIEVWGSQTDREHAEHVSFSNLPRDQKIACILTIADDIVRPMVDAFSEVGPLVTTNTTNHFNYPGPRPEVDTPRIPVPRWFQHMASGGPLTEEPRTDDDNAPRD